MKQSQELNGLVLCVWRWAPFRAVKLLPLTEIQISTCCGTRTMSTESSWSGVQHFIPHMCGSALKWAPDDGV